MSAKKVFVTDGIERGFSKDDFQTTPKPITPPPPPQPVTPTQQSTVTVAEKEK